MELIHVEKERKKIRSRRRQFALRLNIFFFAVFLLFSILIVRLSFLQFVESESLAAKKVNLSTTTVPIPPIRGNIYDANGHAIAYSTATQSLYFRFEPGTTAESAAALAEELEQLFRQLGKPDSPALTKEEIIRRMDLNYIRNPRSVPRRIKLDLSDKEVAYFMENRDKYSGIEVVEESIRNYDPEGIAVQLVGYLRRFDTAVNQSGYLDYYKQPHIASQALNHENVGFDGLEFMYQEVLRGQNGRKTYPRNAAGEITGDAQIVPPVKGHNLILTINRNVQLDMDRAIEEHLQYMREEPLFIRYGGPEATTGFAVAMEVDTGNVVAMSSYPKYDPNIWRDGSITPENYALYQSRFKNGTISESFPHYETYEERAKHPSSLVYLGSTIKPLSILVGLNEGLFTTNTVYQDTGVFQFGRDGSSISNSDGLAYGPVTPFSALVRSSNTFMASQIGNSLYLKHGTKGLDIWDAYMEQFGLGVSTGSGLPGEIRGLKDYYQLEAAGSAQSALVFAAWGQMGKYTALQLAQFAATIASKGKRMRPQFVKEIQDYKGDLVKRFEPEILNEVELKNEAWWDFVHDAMAQVWLKDVTPIQMATGKAPSEYPFTVASKTGTSTQQVYGGQTVDNAVFIAFAPVENPKLAVAVVIPKGGFGAWGAGPIAAKIFESYATHIGFDEQRDE